MYTLFYGAGVIGSLFAGRLHEGGEPVCILARGQRLAELRQHGLVLQEVLTGKLTVCHVRVVEELRPTDAYDLIVVAVHHANAARDEMQQLAEEFKTLAMRTSVPTPAMDLLRSHISPIALPVAEPLKSREAA